VQLGAASPNKREGQSRRVPDEKERSLKVDAKPSEGENELEREEESVKSEL